MENKKEAVTRHKSFGDDGCIYNLECGDGITGICIYLNSSKCIYIKKVWFLYMKYTPVKLGNVMFNEIKIVFALSVK